MLRKLFSFSFAIFAIVSVATTFTLAQPYNGGLRTRPLITQPVDDTKLVTLPGIPGRRPMQRTTGGRWLTRFRWSTCCCSCSAPRKWNSNWLT